jgi:hypothetical protein
VQDTLRAAMRPKSGGFAGYTISFSGEILQSFDQAVSKASCRANIKIEGPGGTLVDTTIDYLVLPAAADPSNFVVSAPTDIFRDRLIQQISEDTVSKEENQAETVEQSRLAALVKPGWLIGRWVPADKGSDACFTGPYLDFGRGNVLHGPSVTGTWRLSGHRRHAAASWLPPDRLWDRSP